MAVTKEQIEKWKAEFGKIYKITPVSDLEIIYKPLSRNDYMDIMSKQIEGLIEDPEIETVKLCILNDIDENDLYSRGGIATVVYEDIMKRSGFTIVESEEL